jgi:hypothetical protein
MPDPTTNASTFSITLLDKNDEKGVVDGLTGVRGLNISERAWKGLF